MYRMHKTKIKIVYIIAHGLFIDCVRVSPHYVTIELW